MKYILESVQGLNYEECLKTLLISNTDMLSKIIPFMDLILGIMKIFENETKWLNISFSDMDED